MNEYLKYKNEGIFEKEEILNSELIPDLTSEYCRQIINQLREVKLTEVEKDVMRSLIKRVNRYENGNPELGIDNNNNLVTGDLNYRGDTYKIYRQEGLTQVSENEEPDNEDEDNEDEEPVTDNTNTTNTSNSLSLKDMIIMALIFGRN
jgi:hypothetical protein